MSVPKPPLPPPVAPPIHVESIACKSSVSYVTLNGTPKGWIYDTSHASPLLKVTQLGLDPTTAPYASLCITLSGACPTMQVRRTGGEG